MLKLEAIALATILINVPFGFWRARSAKLTWPWFMAVHAPVPVLVGLRLVLGVGWTLSTVPLLAGAYLLGQFLGGRLGKQAW